MTYAGKTFKGRLKTVHLNSKLSILRDEGNQLSEVVCLLSASARKMESYLTSKAGDVKTLIYDIALNEIKAFIIINSKHSRQFKTVEEVAFYDDNYKKLVEYIEDYSIYVDSFFEEAFGIKSHIPITNVISKNILETLSEKAATQDEKIQLFNASIAEIEISAAEKNQDIKWLEDIKKYF